MSQSLTLVNKVFVVAAIALVLVSLLNAQRVVFTWYERKLSQRAGTHLLATVVPLLRRSAGIVVMVMGALVILAQLGIEIAPLLAGLGIGGLAVALALQGTLGNFFAGVSLLSDGTVKSGDLVELEDGDRGYVHEIGWRATQIRTLENNMIVIPNSKLAETKALNYSYITQQMAVFFRFGVSYFSDLEQVERVTLEVATDVRDRTEGSVKDFEPILRFTGFGDSNVDVVVIMRADDWAARWLVGHNFTKEIMQRYHEEGIEISFPTRNLWMRDESGGYISDRDAVDPRQQVVRHSEIKGESPTALRDDP